MRDKCKYVRIKEGVLWDDKTVHTECGHMITDRQYFYSALVKNCPYCGGVIEHVKEA